eukprot:UN27327
MDPNSDVAEALTKSGQSIVREHGSTELLSLFENAYEKMMSKKKKQTPEKKKTSKKIKRINPTKRKTRMTTKVILRLINCVWGWLCLWVN